MSLLDFVKLGLRPAQKPKGLERRKCGAPMEALGEPLRPEVAETLAKAFRKTYHFDWPATWQASPAILGRQHREFQQKYLVLFPVNR